MLIRIFVACLLLFKAESVAQYSLILPANGSIGVATNTSLDWSHPASPTGYYLVVSTNPSLTPAVVNQYCMNNTFYNVTGLANHTTYYWGLRGLTPTWSFTTVVAAPVLSAPANGLIWVPMNPTLSWSIPAGATSYNLQVSQVSDPNFQMPFVNQTGLATNSYNVNGLVRNSQYYWRVRVTNAGDTSSWSNVQNFTTGMPSLSSPANGASGISINPTFSWSVSAAATAYNLQVSTASDFSAVVVSQSGITTTSYGASGLSNNTQYYWRLSCSNAGGTSPWSAGQSFTTVVATPVLSSPIAGAIGISVNPTLSWYATPGANSYTLQVWKTGMIQVNQSGITGCSDTISGLSNNTQYFWTVTATNAGGTSAAAEASFTTILAVPVLSSPTNVASGISVNPTIGWYASSGAATYRVQVSTDAGFGSTIVDDSTPTTISETVHSLSPSTAYYWRVNAKNAGGTTGWSAAWMFTTMSLPGVPTLASPANSAANIPISPTLSWSASSGAATYRIQVSTNSGFTSTVVDDSTPITTSEAIGPLISTTTYYWRVNAKNLGGTSAWSTVWSFTTIFVSPPSVPNLTSPSSGAVNVAVNPTLIWGPSSGAASYRVQVSVDPGFSSTVIDDSTVATTSKTAGPLASNTAYYWRVNAKSAGGTSPWSMIWSFSTVPQTTGAPVLSSPTSSSADVALSPTLVWGVTSGAATYRVQLSTDSTFASRVVDDSTVTATSRNVGPLVPSTAYYWRVNAKNLGGISPWSNVWQFSTVPPVPAVPVPIAPANASTNIDRSPSLTWNSSAGAVTYRIQVSTNAGFTSVVVDDSTTTSTSKTIGPLAPNTAYYWRVSARNAGGTSAWSTVWSFTTVPPTRIRPSTFTVTLSGAAMNSGIVRYGVPRPCVVSLSVYDIHGRLVWFDRRTQQPGYYNVNIQRKNLPSGRYLLRFVAGDYVRTVSFLD